MVSSGGFSYGLSGDALAQGFGLAGKASGVGFKAALSAQASAARSCLLDSAAKRPASGSRRRR